MFRLYLYPRNILEVLRPLLRDIFLNGAPKIAGRTVGDATCTKNNKSTSHFPGAAVSVATAAAARSFFMGVFRKKGRRRRLRRRRRLGGGRTPGHPSLSTALRWTCTDMRVTRGRPLDEKGPTPPPGYRPNIALFSRIDTRPPRAAVFPVQHTFSAIVCAHPLHTHITYTHTHPHPHTLTRIHVCTL